MNDSLGAGNPELNGKHYVVVGGASMVGSAITKLLLSTSKTQITILDNFSLSDSSSVQWLRGIEKVDIRPVDVTRLNDLLDAMPSADGIFMTAGYLTLPLAADPRRGIEVNINGLVNVAEAAKLRGIPRLVFSSSIAVYGNAAGKIEECHPFVSAGLSAPFVLYATSKLMGENVLRSYQERHGLSYTALRYSTIYGENQHDRGANSKRLLRAFRELESGNPAELEGDTSVHDFVHVDDVARANVCAMGATAQGGSYNIASGTATGEYELLKTLTSAAGYDREPVFRGRREPENRVAQSASDLCLDVERALTHLRWAPSVDLNEGLTRLVDWWRRNT